MNNGQVGWKVVADGEDGDVVVVVAERQEGAVKVLWKDDVEVDS
jgi:hypothetical protein